MKTDVVVDTLEDLRNFLYKNIFFIENEQEKTEAKNKQLEQVKIHLNRVEKVVSLYGLNGFSVGTALTWADLQLYEVTTDVVLLYEKLLDDLVAIKSVRKTVENHEKVGPYLKSRPITSY